MLIDHKHKEVIYGNGNVSSQSAQMQNTCLILLFVTTDFSSE